jgi:RNA polymerase sigma-54 factor
MWRRAMKLDFNLQISQRQGLALTAQVQQAIKLLQMTNLEICEFVESQFQDNPFIEETEFHEKNVIGQQEQKSTTELDKSFEAAPYQNSDKTSKLSQENQFETGETYTPRSTVSKEQSDFDILSLVEDTAKSLYSHCTEFCSSLELAADENLIAMKLVEDLEPTGWITTNLTAIADELGVDLTDVEDVLVKLQKIEPAGLFARNLKECLTLQAIDREILCQNLKIVLENLHLIGAGKFDLLKRRTGCSDAQIAKIFAKIKSLDPKPGLQFNISDEPIRQPDLIVTKTEEGWSVELNNSTLPEVRISKEFAKEVKTKTVENSERTFIREKIVEAKWLQNAINKRNETMLKVGSEIIKRQTEFLEKGGQYIQPMILNDVAEAVNMHESTISRVTTGSLIQTPRGTLELKAFFSVGVRQDTGSDPASAASIRFRIKKLIQQENPNTPISDDQIVEHLTRNGVNVARRTVAKYRKIENIPSSFARKRHNVISGATS